MCDKSFSCVSLWDPVDHSPPDSSVHGLSRQESWNGLPALLQGVFPAQILNPHLLCLLHWQGGSLLLVPPGKLRDFPYICTNVVMYLGEKNIYMYVSYNHNFYILYTSKDLRGGRGICDL